jgi:hypothetical protein
MKSPCFSLLSAGIIGVSHHDWQLPCFLFEEFNFLSMYFVENQFHPMTSGWGNGFGSS